MCYRVLGQFKKSGYTLDWVNEWVTDWVMEKQDRGGALLFRIVIRQLFFIAINVMSCSWL